MTEARVDRRLTAVLAADMVGYSRLVETDEAGTIDRQRALHQDLIEPEIDRFGGRLVKTMGDGWLAEFSSVVAAVECAMTLQRRVAEHESDIPEVRRIRYRMGINLGDVVVEGDDILGDGVNVAARLEALADPGGICVSDTVYHSIEGKLDVVFVSLGAQPMKNIARPVAVYRVETGVAGPVPSASERALEAPLTDKPSIAVLPFENLSGDAEQQYFSDGLADDIITALTHFRSFPVIARNSTFVYRGAAIDAKTIATQLGATYILEGSVRRGAGRVRIAAQLVYGKTGHHVWADRYDRDIDDIFALQDEIAHRIAATIVPELGRAEQKRAAAKRTSDLTAWDYYLRGNAYLNAFTCAGNAEARTMFQRAIDLDPAYGDAFTGLAESFNRDLLLNCIEDRPAAMDAALAAARRAVGLDEASGAAHHALSTAYIWRDEHDLALPEARLAVDLNPSDAVSLHALGNKADLAGDPDGIGYMLEAQRLNRQDPRRHAHLSFLARAYIKARDYAAAERTAAQALQRRPDYPHAHFIRAIALGHLGRTAEARAALDACERLQPGFVAGRADWHPYLDDGSNRHLHEGLRKAEG